MKDTTLTPEIFWEKFASEFRQWWNRDASLKNKYETNKPWTCKMTCFLSELGEKLGYSPDYEWLSRIDVCYFLSHDGKWTDWAEWSCEAAIEHENGGLESSREECSKLMSINAGLKVIITYYNEENEDELKKRLNDYLDDFQRIYKSRRYHQEDDKYLLIFLPNSTLLNKGVKNAVAYTFTDSKIQPLNEEDIFSEKETTP